MKHVFLLLLVLALTSCRLVPVDPLPHDPRPIEVYGLTLSSNLKTPQGLSVICDDRTTYLTYSFYYRGALESWTSRLYGEWSGQMSDPQTFPRWSRPPVIVTSNYVEVTYEVPPRLAPLATSGLAPQSIIVVPAPSTVIGRSSLLLRVRDVSGFGRNYRSSALPVLDRCY